MNLYITNFFLNSILSVEGFIVILKYPLNSLNFKHYSLSHYNISLALYASNCPMVSNLLLYIINSITMFTKNTKLNIPN